MRNLILLASTLFLMGCEPDLICETKYAQTEDCYMENGLLVCDLVDFYYEDCY